MEDLLIFITAIFVNNVVFSQFLGICPFLGVSKKVETAAGMGAAVAFVLTIATIVTFLITFFFGRRLSKTYWFERTIFAWGWWTGTMAMGIALLRIVDPKLSSKAMDDYALAYLPIAPLEIALITFAPILFANGMGVWLLVGCLALAAITILIAWFMKWFVPRKR